MVPVQILLFSCPDFLLVFFPDMVKPIFFMYEFLATLSTFYNWVVVDLSGMLYKFLITFKLGTALVTLERFVKYIHRRGP